ncbi:MAG: SNF2-related protein [Treponemataceae bacterium]
MKFVIKLGSGLSRIEKAMSHKYIKRIPKANGKGWNYIYKETFKKPIQALISIFGFTEGKIDADYNNLKIKESYGVDKKSYAAHVLEFFTNKEKWNNLFSQKEKRDLYKKPVNSNTIKEKIETPEGELSFDELKEKKDPINRSLMRKVWSIYSMQGKQIEQQEKDDILNKKPKGGELNERNRIKTEHDGVSNNNGDVLNGKGEGDSNTNVLESQLGDNGGSFIQLPIESGIELGGREAFDRDTVGRLTKGKAKKIREQCKLLLEEKSNDEMTEKDKALLRQYEGAGGLGEGGQSNAAVLSEFYTPRDVIAKMWELVDKYNPNQNKKVIEPSSGIGRFAENRTEEFTLCELDETSARIAEILHPDSEVKQGAFQNLFVKNNSVQKKYTGDKYDVAIGNPPYGEYAGLYKGMGEGKIHTRYEEYFIERTLDTLKDGGIMAFIVPSGFLRGKNSKAKEEIAKKGKLLEAWRLPKGTFSSTDVGTDIIILKKESGSIDDFLDNKYFKDNESKVIGNESDGGNWGTKIINLPEGKTVEQAVQMIDVNAVNFDNEIKEIEKKVSVVAENEIKKRFTVIGKLKEGSKIVESNGKAGKITYITKEGLVGFEIEGGGMGRISIDNFDVADDKKTAEELHKIRSDAMLGNDNAKKLFKKELVKKVVNGDVFTQSIGKNMTADEFNKKYSKEFDEKDIKFWKVTDWEGKVEVNRLTDKERDELKSNKSFVQDEKGNYVNVCNYASGNIYEKLHDLESNKSKIQDDVYIKNKALLESVIPEKKDVNQFTVSPIANFAKTFKDEYGNSLTDQFLEYCGFSGGGYAQNSPISKNELDDGLSLRDIWEYINQIPVRAERSHDKEGAAMMASRKRKSRRDVAERLFNDWIRQLPESKQKSIEESWNKKFNAYVNPDFSKIPLFVDGMNEYKGSKKFDLTTQQIKGVSWLCNKGNGILAYDVGVGKTVTGIVATVNQLQTGKSKRPLVCVPKAVYKKWIKEIKQHFPDIKVNELYNLNDKTLSTFKDAEGKINIPENAINICTYNALDKITFNSETLSGDLTDDMLDSQSVHDYDDNGNKIPDKRSDRQRAADNEKLMTQLGIAAGAKEGSIFWEDLGIDLITVDELHNFKNIFKTPRSFGRSVRSVSDFDEKKDQLSNEYSGIQGAESKRGYKMFAISQLIQRKTDGRGFFGLSATPFNNSPLEIYNILSLVARNRLKELGIYNLQDFLKEFAEMKPDWKVTETGDVKSELVMKNFKNLSALQRLITEYIDKVDGEEAGVVRPFKRIHKPELDMTPLQKAIFNAERDRVEGKFKTGNDKQEGNAETLIAMNNMRLATLSPSLIDPKFYEDYEGYEGWKVPKPEDIVKESPKLQFVCDTSAEQYKLRPTEGQVIYMPRGVKSYKYVKDYLVSKGMPVDSIAFMAGAETPEKKQEIMNDFNNKDGKIKIIIGSETIKEGVSLNGNSTTLYNTMLGWNPTETIQVEGRIWRQGNEQGVTHIVYPLMNDSIDSMMYQKYDEKSSRLNALWSYK